MMVTYVLVVKSRKEKWPLDQFFESLVISLLVDFLVFYPLVVNGRFYF
jgi:hypothetical protein